MQHKFHKRANRPSDLARWELRLRICHEHPSWAVRLWAGVLSDAIRVLRTVRTAIRRREVYEWIAAADDMTVFGSFSWVCAELDLDEPYVRRDILAMGAKRERTARQRRA